VRRILGRLVRVLVLAAVLCGVGWVALEPAERMPGADIARDYLAFRRVQRHADVLRAAGLESGVDPYLLAAVMVAESSGRVGAKSHKGALGLFQLMPITARWRAEVMGLPPPTEEQLLSDALLNARLGANNLAWLLRTYDGDVERALVAYNLGTRRLAVETRAAGGWDAWRLEREAAGSSQLLAYAGRVVTLRDRLRARGLLDEPLAAATSLDSPGEPR
jgi:soluble lytic murein transglycosylase-like protein